MATFKNALAFSNQEGLAPSIGIDRACSKAVKEIEINLSRCSGVHCSFLSCNNSSEL